MSKNLVTSELRTEDTQIKCSVSMFSIHQVEQNRPGWVRFSVE